MRRRLLAGLLLGLVVIIALTLAADFRQVGAHLAAFDWSRLPLILGGTLLNYALRFIKWHYFLGRIGVGDLALRQSLRIFVAGFPLAVTPGKIGEALKAVWLQQTGKAPFARGVTVVLAERISDGLAVLALSTLGVIAYPQYWPAFAAVLGLLISGIVLSQIRPLALKVLDWLARIPRLARFSASLLEFYEGTYALFRPRATLTAVGLGFFAWLGEGAAMYLVLRGLGVPAGWQVFSLAVFVLSFSTVIGAVSALPGGLGAAEVSITGMLTLLLHLPASSAAAATLLIRFATLWFGVALGLLVWVFSSDLLLGSIEDQPAAAL